ncbi:MAG: hypothetical protein ABL867_01530 [Rickettsiales bacterium]
MATFTDSDMESKNIICCLEFLSQQALASHMLAEHSILKNTITEISKVDSLGSDIRHNVEYSDIITAFKFFAKFCLVEDKDTKKHILHLIENLDVDTMSNYAQNKVC